MNHYGKSLLIGGIGAMALCAGIPARAQNNVSPGASPAPAAPSNAIGAPQLRDFELPGSRRVVAQPPANQPPVAQVAPPSPVTAGPGQSERPHAVAARPQTQAPRAGASAQQQPATAAPQPLPAPGSTPAPATSSNLPSPPAETAPAPSQAVPGASPGEGFPWLYAIPASAALLVIGLALLRRRRRNSEISEAFEAAVEAPAAPPSPKPVPVPRPWLELELKAERAQSTNVEAVVDFELEIVNSGKAPARNLRIDVKMFNAGQEQDQEIGAFFRSAGRESTKCQLPGIAPDTTGVIRGSVAMPRDEIKALLLQDRYLFVPVIAVNALYDWGDGQTGQTSKSYVVGRELEQPSEKMGAFRVDLGPRVWRTVGQRQHKLARRV